MEDAIEVVKYSLFNIPSDIIVVRSKELAGSGYIVIENKVWGVTRYICVYRLTKKRKALLFKTEEKHMCSIIFIGCFRCDVNFYTKFYRIMFLSCENLQIKFYERCLHSLSFEKCRELHVEIREKIPVVKLDFCRNLKIYQLPKKVTYAIYYVSKCETNIFPNKMKRIVDLECKDPLVFFIYLKSDGKRKERFIDFFER